MPPQLKRDSIDPNNTMNIIAVVVYPERMPVLIRLSPTVR
jgi:hypothetical protein